MTSAPICIDDFDDEPSAVLSAIERDANHTPEYRLACEGDYLWTAGDLLLIRFLDSVPEVDKEVLRFARKWCNYANIKFRITDDSGAHIRITYDGAANKSKVGRRSDARVTDGPSMWLPSALDEAWRQRVVLHEVGHALGCIHEHSSPNAGIPWSPEAVRPYYRSLGKSDGWIETNVLGRAMQSTIRASAYDPESIMLYPIPAELLLDPTKAVGWNTTLSACDQKYIRRLYPFPGDESRAPDC